LALCSYLSKQHHPLIIPNFQGPGPIFLREVPKAVGAGYCNSDVDKLIDQQSLESNRQNRQKLVWEIERKLAEDGARPIIHYGRGATCWQPRVKGLTVIADCPFPTAH
jgi:hypothetical protein